MVGKVVEVLDNYREHIMDGVVFQTPDGVRRFVDAPEVARTAELGVTLTIRSAEAAQLGPPDAEPKLPDRPLKRLFGPTALSHAVTPAIRVTRPKASLGKIGERGETMADEQAREQDGGGRSHGPGHASPSPTTAPARPTRSRSPTARSRRWTFARSRSAEDDFGLMTYDPAFTNTASCRSSVCYIDGEAGILEYRGYPIEELCEKLHLPRGRLSPDLRRAADAGPARRVDLRDHPPHLRPREHQEVRRGLPLRRAPDGHAARHRRRAVHLLPGRQEHRRRAPSATWRRCG